jgi:hypothetical protein
MDLSFLSCQITHDRLSDIDVSCPLHKLERSFEINDDLLQGAYRSGLVLDVGWFDLESISNIDGPYRLRCFLVRLIRASDWTTPAAQFVARTFAELNAALRAAEQWATSPEIDDTAERVGPRLQWELWEFVHDDGTQESSYFPSTQDHSRRGLDPRAQRFWTAHAFDYNDAMQQRNDYSAWGRYKPIPTRATGASDRGTWVVSDVWVPYTLLCRMQFERPQDDRLPAIGFCPNIWIEGAGGHFLLGRIDKVTILPSTPEMAFELEMTVIGADALGFDVAPGLAVCLLRGGWTSIWLAGQVSSYRKKEATQL